MMYRLIRFVLGLSLRGFFRTVSVQGIDRIPRSGPVLLISNHANAFVDPLLVLMSVQRRITLTAKSTLLGQRRSAGYPDPDLAPRRGGLPLPGGPEPLRPRPAAIPHRRRARGA